jgi:hypothetical protein
LSRAKAVFIPPAELVVVARSSYPTQKQRIFAQKMRCFFQVELALR